MKYPLENDNIWSLVRHPFEENDGDPGSRSYMRLLSLVIFAVYLIVQTYVPINFFLTQYYEQEAPLLMAILFSVMIFVALFSGYLVTASLVRYFTSLYFLKYIRVNILLFIVLCTKKNSRNKEKLQEKLDAAMIELGIVRAQASGKELSLEDIANPAVDYDAIDSGVRSYMEDNKGKYTGKNIATLFLFLTDKKLILSDNLAHFYRVLNASYPDSSWVSDNAVLKSVNSLAGGEKLAELEKGIAKNYFSQIQTD